MSFPQETWGHPDWIRYFRDHMKRSVETDIRPLIATHGAFGIPRQFFPHIEYLSGLVFGPADGQNLATTAHTEKFLKTYMKRIDPLYETQAPTLLAMWRHGVIHTYQPKVLETHGGARMLGWLNYYGTRKDQAIEPLPGQKMIVSHLTLHVGKNTLDHLPVANDRLVEDLDAVLELIAGDLEAEQSASGTTLLKNMQRAARHLGKPVPEKKPKFVPSEQDLKDAARFVWYEWDQFTWAIGAIRETILVGRQPEDWRAGTGGRNETERAMVEVALLHARALRDFFNRGRGDRGVHPTDMLAADYVQPPESWTSPEFEYLTDGRERLNRALAHLAYDRTEYAVLGADWDFKKINDEVEAAWKAFMADLSDERRAWFDPPTDAP